MTYEQAKREETANCWASYIRCAAVEEVKEVFPGVEQESMPGRKLQMLARAYLSKHLAAAVADMEGYEKEQAEAVKREAMPLVFEELLPPILSETEQIELSMLLLDSLDRGKRTVELLPGVLSNIPELKNVNPVDAAETLEQKLFLKFRELSRERCRRPRSEPEKRSGMTFPEGYPYMDEFEYTDHCIAGDDDD